MAVSNSTDRFNGVVASKAIKVSCAIATIADIVLSGSQVIDTVTVVTGDRVLVRAQTNPVENGIYNVLDNAWERAADWDGSRDITQGTLAGAFDGAGDLRLYVVSTADPITIGSTSVTIDLYLQGAGAGIDAGTITNAMLRWDGVDTWREAARIRATVDGANFQVYEVTATDFLDVSYVGATAIFVLSNAGHNFSFQSDVVVIGADFFVSGGDSQVEELLTDDITVREGFAINWLDSLAASREMVAFAEVSRAVSGVGSVIANFDGTDGDITYTGDDARVWTWGRNQGFNELSNTQAKFGSTSYYCGNTGAGDDDIIYVDVEAEYTAGDFVCGTRDWFVRFWWFTGTSQVGGHDFCAISAVTTGTRAIRWQTNNNVYSIAYDSNASGAEDTFPTFGASPSDSIWHEIVFERVGNSIYCYEDGVQQGSTFDCRSRYSSRRFVHRRIPDEDRGEHLRWCCSRLTEYRSASVISRNIHRR
jgi:hypothetical protein